MPSFFRSARSNSPSRLPYLQTASHGGPGGFVTSPTEVSGTPVAAVRTRQRKGSLRKVALSRQTAERRATGESDSGPSPRSSTDGEPGCESDGDTTIIPGKSTGPQPKSPSGSASGTGRSGGNGKKRAGVSPAQRSQATGSSSGSGQAMQRRHRPSRPAINTSPSPSPSPSPSGAHSHSPSRSSSPGGPLHLKPKPAAPSPLSHASLPPPTTPSIAADPSDPWDYSETVWWGWVILILTWIVFVIGMGSCFGVWSWAWDVGTTPYAPPELEDDPTLPITGYYPALIILTVGIMAWVWAFIAWVGMKYFRHAKISGD